MSDSKKNNWLPWVAVAALVYFVALRPSGDSPDNPKPEPSMSVSKVLDDAYKADRRDKIETLREFTHRDFASDDEALRWFNEDSARRRIETFTPYTDRVGEAMFNGTVPDLLSRLEAGR